MSKTDNTQPLLLQWDDKANPGRVNHYCHEHWKPTNTGHRDCEYEAFGNTLAFRDVDKWGCRRVAYSFGGKRSFGGWGKYERKLRQRKLRRREREALYRVRVSNFEDDFDLLPIREDNDTLAWDLS